MVKRHTWKIYCRTAVLMWAVYVIDLLHSTDAPDLLPFTDKFHWMWNQSCSLLWSGCDKRWNEESLGNFSKQFEALSLKGFSFFLSKEECVWSVLSFQIYWLGPMCGGTAAALIYDFLLYPRTPNLRTRGNVLLHGQQDENNAAEITGVDNDDNGSPGPSQWPKHWSACHTLAFLSVGTVINSNQSANILLKWRFGCIFIFVLSIFSMIVSCVNVL